MKIKISKKNRRLAVIYLALLVILYLVIYVVPKVTTIFETTQVLETGTLTVSCDGTGYIVKDETITTADGTGELVQSVFEGTVVKKGTKIVSIDNKDSDSGIRSKYKPFLKKLRNYAGVKPGSDAPISGVCSYSMDGNEKYFAIDNLDRIKKDKVESLDYDTLDLKRNSAKKGEPVFKISRDDNWYVVFWFEKEQAKEYEDGMDAILNFPDGSVPAKVFAVHKDDSLYKVIFYVNSYYESFASTRKADITIVKSNNTGLIIDNDCIVDKKGVTGVYVKDKDGDYQFKPIKVKASDGKQSVVYDATFTNENYELVETVNVYDEVLRDPKSALEKDLKKER